MAEVFIDQKALERACTRGDWLLPHLEAAASGIASRATSLGSRFETQRTVRYATGERVGGHSPQYRSGAKDGRRGPVGIVATANYAAMKGELEHGFLLRAKG